MLHYSKNSQNHMLNNITQINFENLVFQDLIHLYLKYYFKYFHFKFGFIMIKLCLSKI